MTRPVILDAAAGTLAHPKADRVVILGKGPTAATAVVGPDDECWGMNAGSDDRATRWVQIHPLNILPRDEVRAIRWAMKAGVPCYTVRHHPTLPGTLRYPLERVQMSIAMLGSTAHVWTSSFDYMMALAIAEEFKEIVVAGVDLADGTLRERMIERAGFMYWLGFARGRGIRVTMAGEARATPYKYGVEYFEERAWARYVCRKAVAWALRMQLDDGAARK